MSIKNNSFIISISLFPLTLLLLILRLINFLKSNLYDYLIFLMFIIFLIYFIIALFFALDDIIYSNKKSRIIWLILFSIFYLPIYYTKYVSQEEKYLGYFLLLASLILSGISFYFVSDKYAKYLLEIERKKIVLKTTYEYSDRNKLFTIKVDNNYRCDNHLGDYALSCDSYSDDSFFGIYVYYDKETKEEEEEIFSFHVEQTLDYIKENNYEAEINYLDDEYFVQINYQDMTILMMEKTYLVNDKQYNLIIVKELPNSENAVDNFLENIKTLQFIS